MAHGERAERLGHAGREYWSPRKPAMMPWGSAGKQATHERERAEKARLVHRLKANEHIREDA